MEWESLFPPIHPTAFPHVTSLYSVRAKLIQATLTLCETTGALEVNA